MAERRVQVKELDVPSMSSVTPTARPVDTYVKPAKEEFVPSELSQFLSAITPAIKAEADERLKVRLERERQINAGIYKNKLNQAYQHSVQIAANLNQDYVNNKDEYLSFRDDEEGTAADKILAIRQENIDANIAALRSENVDPIIISALENDLQTANTAFMKDVYLKDKAIQHEEEVYGKFGNSLVAVMDNGTDLDSQLIDINELYLSFVDANGGNHKKALDLMWTLAEERSRTQANNGIVEWLKSPFSSPEGQPAQWGVAKRAKQRGVIEARGIAQDKATAAGLTTQLTTESLANNAASAYSTGNMSDLATDRDTVLSNGKVIKHQPDDYIPYIESEFASEIVEIQSLEVDDNTKTEMILEANRKRFKFYSTFNLMPPQLSKAVSNGKTILTQGDLTNPDNLEKVKDMYDQLNMADAYSNGGITSTALKGDDYTRFRHLQALINGGYDFQAAVGMVQGKLYDGRSITITDEDVKQAVDNNFFPTWSKEASARNIGVITDEVSRLAEAILQTDPTANVESAKKTAMQLVAADYKFIEGTDGNVTAIRVESNALNDPINVKQIEQGLLDIQSDPELRAFINEELGVEDRAVIRNILGVESLDTAAGFDIYVKSTGNPNQLYVYAKPYDEEQEGTINLLLGTVSIWDFNANRIKGLKEQLLQKKAAVTDQMSGVTSTTPTLQEGGAAGEGSLDAAVASVANKVGEAVLTDDDSVREQAINNILENLKKVEEQEAAIAASFDDDIAEELDDEGIETLANTALNMPEGTDVSVLKDAEVTADDVETISSFEPSEGSKIVVTGDLQNSVIETLKAQEGFESEPYDDMGSESVGYGFQIASLEPDERALIKDINNVTQAEADAVLRLKSQKAETWWTGEVENFSTLPEETKVAAISMGYQLGLPNLTEEWPKFMEAMKRAGQAGADSWERTEALLEAQFHMLYNEAKDGTIKATKWVGQTADRAMENAEAIASGAWNWFTQKTGEAWDGAVSMVKDIDKARQQVGVALIPAHFRMFAQDITGVRIDQIRTEDFFQDDELEAMRGLVFAQMQQGKTSGAVEYKNYDKGVADVSWKGNVDPLSLGDAQGAVKKTLGQFNWRINNKGEVIITDQYNFNDAKKYREMYPTQAERLAHLTALAGLVATDEMSAYGWLRRVGALYGSAEGEGAKFEVNLGKLN